MIDREKVIRTLKACGSDICDGCPYCGEDGWCTHIGGTVEVPADVLSDALALLKAQEARVIKLGEVRNWVNSDRVTREPVVIEIRGGVCAWIIDDEVREIPGEENLTSDLYGKTWRCWTSRPTDEQREATAWN